MLLHFEYFLLASLLCWVGSWITMVIKKPVPSITATLALSGSIVLMLFVALLWIELDRPPLRTLGETRLWYSVVLSLIGALLYIRWRFSAILFYCHFLSLVFLVINFFKPDTFSKTLMPALQSPWFVPHVIVYMIAYACLGASFVVACAGLIKRFSKWTAVRCIELADRLVYVGFGFLTLGLVFGALWAKEAWGHYWTWDPKETWAFISWGVYLVYIHKQLRGTINVRSSLWVLSISFVALLVCWFGINYLPAAQNSVHVYSQ